MKGGKGRSKDREKKEIKRKNQEDEKKVKMRRRNDYLLGRVKGYKGKEKEDAGQIERFF